MKLTVIVTEAGAACNIGAPVTYRRITVDLTPEQTAALTLNDRWDSHGTAFIELEAPDLVCSCPMAAMERESGTLLRDSDGKCIRCGKRASPEAPPHTTDTTEER